MPRCRCERNVSAPTRPDGDVVSVPHIECVLHGFGIGFAEQSRLCCVICAGLPKRSREQRDATDAAGNGCRAGAASRLSERLVCEVLSEQIA